VSITVYVVTNVKRGLTVWETWYPIGLHVVPGIWSTVITTFHERFLF
jgi:hypothetical protein